MGTECACIPVVRQVSCPTSQGTHQETKALRIYLVFSEREQMVAEAWSLNQQVQERLFSVKQVPVLVPIPQMKRSRFTEGEALVQSRDT